jgi:hypothetical protein
MPYPAAATICGPAGRARMAVDGVIWLQQKVKWQRPDAKSKFRR